MTLSRRGLSDPNDATGVVTVASAGPGATLRRVLSRLPLHVAIIGLAALWLIPTLALLVSSFRDPSAIAATGWWEAIRSPLDFTLGNYDEVLSQRNMARAFRNSVIITVPSTLLIIMVASFAAYAFAWMRFPGRDGLFIVVIALLVVPLQMTLIPILRLYSDLRVEEVPIIGGELPFIGGGFFGTGSFSAMWLAHTAYGLPFAVFLLRNFFGGLPRDLFESAYIDGASDVLVFFRIVLPLSVPAIASLAIFQFLWVWNDLLVALVFLGDPSLFPMTVQVQSLVSSFGSNYQVLTSAAFISMMLPMAVFFALQRYFVQGILAGAVKG